MMTTYEYKMKCYEVTKKIMDITLKIEARRLRGDFSKTKLLQKSLTSLLGKGGSATVIKRTATRELRHLIEFHIDEQGMIKKTEYIKAMRKLISVVSKNITFH